MNMKDSTQKSSNNGGKKGIYNYVLDKTHDKYKSSIFTRLLGRTGIKKWKEPLEACDPASDNIFFIFNSVPLTAGIRNKKLKCRCTYFLNKFKRCWKLAKFL